MIIWSNILSSILNNKFILLFHICEFLSVHVLLDLVIVIPLSLHVDFIGFHFVHLFNEVLSSLCILNLSLSLLFLLFKFNDSSLYQYSLLLSVFLCLDGLVHFILLLIWKSAQSTIEHFAFLRRALCSHHLGLSSYTTKTTTCIVERFFAFLWLVFVLNWHFYNLKYN